MITRCAFTGKDKPFYERYHDDEWGIPVHDDRTHLEFLILESFQAGLSWELILKRREAFRTAFHNFVPEKLASMTDKKLRSLEKNRAIIRNSKKIFAARNNAIHFLKIQSAFGSFDAYVWSFIGNAPQINQWKTPAEVPCMSPESLALSNDLKKWGMTFVGPKIIYAYMQAIGMVNDHTTDCFCHPNNK